MTLQMAYEANHFLITGTVTLGTTYSGTYGIRQSFRPYGGTLYPLEVGSWTGTFWLRYYVAGGDVSVINSSAQMVNIYDDLGTAVFRLRGTANSQIIIDYWDGVAYQTLGTYFATEVFGGFGDVKIVLGASGNISFYDNNNQILSVNLDLSHISAIENIAFRTNVANANASHFSEIIWGDESTIEHRIAVGVPTSDGFYTDGVGGYSNVDDLNEDALTVSLSNANERNSFKHSAITAPPVDFVVKTVQVDTQLRNDGGVGGPQNAKAFLRINSVDYDQTTAYANIDAGYTYYKAKWDTNPSTSLAWLMTDALDVLKEFGIKAEA